VVPDRTGIFDCYDEETRHVSNHLILWRLYLARKPDLWPDTERLALLANAPQDTLHSPREESFTPFVRPPKALVQFQSRDPHCAPRSCGACGVRVPGTALALSSARNRPVSNTDHSEAQISLTRHWLSSIPPDCAVNFTRYVVCGRMPAVRTLLIQ